MNNRYRTTENIDQIGTKVLKAIRVQDREIDNIVLADDLFEPVRAAIGDRQKQASNTVLHSRSGVGIRNWSLTAAAILVVATITSVYFVRQGIWTTDIAADAVASIPVDNLDLPPIEIPKTLYSAINDEETARIITKKHPVSRHSRPETEEVGEFQTVTDTGDDNVTGQIVRVELPRSSLFAMGVDVPVENQTTNKVKADLLISEDGVMRAVRIVD